MSTFLKMIGYAALLLLFIFVLFYNTEKLGRFMYPIHYQDTIEQRAKEYNVDPLLVASIIRTESNYKPHLVSKKNAVGLMQIMPETADWIIDKARFSDDMKERLDDIDVNIRLGTWYLQWILHRFQAEFPGGENTEDEIAIVAAAYNAGHNKLMEWFQRGVWDGRYENIHQIPYGETRHYVKRVLYYYKKYDAFYSGALKREGA